MPKSATNDEELADLRLKAAMYEHLLEQNRQLESQIETLKGVQAGTQKTLDLVTNDLKKRSEQIGQAMLNLAEIAGAAKQQTTSIKGLSTTVGALGTRIVDAIKDLKEPADASE